ncbi:uncharacterized protein DSM5745_08641 [Aspergillus mulundensis]|uniref:Leucine-rich repeat domain-containing protein n=1 Tax=Aspergillus mulundensis TaxID=1810919 RepID=A0A3D8R4M7_9EURO|nr:hypothetical protein DSM5745_08641 [Aspergillus mulundensis]RDW68881.1 hypothetical protein DSM5745_08641 [Aspergillus mulundensis]
MAEFTSLPNEILILIAESICNRDDRLNLARCSKQLYETLMPVAFSCISVPPSHSLWRISVLVHLLLRKPQYAEAVRILDMGECGDNPFRNFRYKRRLILEALKRVTLTEEALSDWENRLRGNGKYGPGAQHDGWCALLLTTLSSVEVLNIGRGDDTNHHQQMVLDGVLHKKKPFDRLPILRRLREFAMMDSDNPGEHLHFGAGIPLDLVLAFFEIPTMRKLSCYDVFNQGPEIRVSGYSNITHFTIRSSFCQSGFSGLIRACKALKSFVYEHVPSAEPLNLPTLYRSLCIHKETLEKLAIYHEICSWDPQPEDNVFLGSFEKFTSLKSLRLRANNLLSWTEFNEPVLNETELDESESDSRLNNHLWGTIPDGLEDLTIDEFTWCPCVLSLVEVIEDIYRNACPDDKLLDSLRINGRFAKGEKPVTAAQGPDFLLPGAESIGSLLRSSCGGRTSFAMYDSFLEKTYGDGLIPEACYRRLAESLMDVTDLHPSQSAKDNDAIAVSVYVGQGRENSNSEPLTIEHFLYTWVAHRIFDISLLSMEKPAAVIAAHVALILDRVNVPSILWGWTALALLQRDMKFPDIEFVIPDDATAWAVAALVAERYPHCRNPTCMEFDEARMPNADHITVDERRRYHVVGSAHFHAPWRDETYTVTLLRKSETLFWLPDIPRGAPHQNMDVMLSTDSTVPNAGGLVPNGPTGPWSRRYPMRVLNPVSFTESYIWLECRDYERDDRFMELWANMLHELYDDAIFKKCLRPRFMPVWEGYVANRTLEPGRPHPYLPLLDLRDEMIENGELPANLPVADRSMWYFN